MRSLLPLLFAMSVFSSIVAAENIVTLNTTGKPPLNTSTQTGFMDQVAKQAFQRIGIVLNTVQLPAERGLKNANAGIEDGEMSRIAGLEKIYPNLKQVPEKIMDWHFVGFSYQNIPLDKGWASLAPYSTAYINGWKILENNIKFPEVTKVKSSEQLFTLIKKNRTDVIIYEQWGGLLLKKQLAMHDLLLLSPPLAIKPMFIYLHKKHSHLIKPLANALREMKEDGSYQKIYDAILNPLTI